VNDLQTYRRYRDYLHDWFWHQKAVNTKVSFRYMAKHLGLTSPNHIHLVISGKRHLSAVVLDRFLKLAKLNTLQKQFLKLLMVAETATTETKKKKAEVDCELLRKRLASTQEISPETLAIVSDRLAWHLCAGAKIFAGLSRSDLEVAVLRLSLFPLSPEIVRGAILSLENAGKLRFEQDRAEFDESSILTKWDFDSSAVKKHHKSNLELAMETVPWPIDRRFLTSITVAMSQDLKSQIVAEIRAFYLSILERSQSLANEPQQTEVVTIQLAMFPYFKSMKSK
jgi:uncharacterized protein (TIGR02147 family)